MNDRPFGMHDGQLRLPGLRDLARRMSGVSGRIVIDQTGLDGIDVTIRINTLTESQLAGDDARSKAMAIRDAYFADLVHGAEALGLRVEGRKGPLEFVVIDSAVRQERIEGSGNARERTGSPLGQRVRVINW